MEPIDPKITIKILGNSPEPNQMVISGIHANGGIALNALNSGVKNAFALSFQPIKIPKAIPKVQLKSKAIKILIKLCQM